MQLFVLGMHRSGTSAVTRILNLAGAYFGHEGVSNGADEGNPKGFWERVDVRSVCDGLLKDAESDWWRVSDFSVDAISEDVRERRLKEFRDIVLELDAHRPWVIKEPRLCLLFPVLRSALEVPVCIHVAREPLEVAASLQSRNGFPLPFGLALWELYTLRSLEASADVPRLLVRHEDLMTNPIETVARLVEQLTVLGVPRLQVPADAEITAFIDPTLYRERRARDDRVGWLNESQAILAAALDEGCLPEGSEQRDVSAGALAALRQFERQRADVESLHAALAGSEADLRDVRATTAKLSAQLDAAERKVSEFRAELSDLRATTRAETARQRAQLESAERGFAREETRSRAAVSKVLQATEQDVRGLAHGRTWRAAWRVTSIGRRLLPGVKRAQDPIERVAAGVHRSAVVLDERYERPRGTGALDEEAGT